MDLLEEMDDYVSRNGTERSRLCERLVRTFDLSGACMARVRHDRTRFGADELYRGLCHTCDKSRYRGRIRASRRGGEVYLKKRRRGENPWE